MTMTLPEALAKARQNFRGKTCIQFRTDSLLQKVTYDEIVDSAVKIGSRFSGAGIQKGDRIALLAENCPEWCLCYFGILFSGAVAVPLDVQMTLSDVEYILKDADCRMVLVSASYAFLQELKKSHAEKIILVSSPASDGGLPTVQRILEGSSADTANLPPLNSEDLASIIYTSGTTGFPKGVMLTHANFYANYVSISKLGFIGPTDNALALLPLHHTYAFMCILIAPLFCGAQVTYLDSLKSDRILRCLTEDKITVMPTVPQILNYFYQGIAGRIASQPFFVRWLVTAMVWISGTVRSLTRLNLGRLLFTSVHSRFGKQLRFFVSGGARLDEDVARFFYCLGMNVLEGYGLTEAAPVVSFNPPGRTKSGSVGKALEGVEIKIADPDKTGMGQILVRGPNVMKGYYGRDTDTAEVLKNGWLYTGDLGYLDKDRYLYIKGRLKEIIVLSSGKNISPEEVERHYLQAPEIKEMAVLADESEEKLAAVIVPDEEHFRKVGKAGIHGFIKWRLEFLSERLPSYKRIRSFVLSGTGLPRTRLGKLKRMDIRQIYQQCLKRESSGQGVTGTAETEAFACFEKLAEILRKNTGAKHVSLADHLELDLGMDSLGRVEALIAIEKAFGIRMSESDFSKIFTVRELAKQIEGMTSGPLPAQVQDRAVEWKKILEQDLPAGLKDAIDFKSTQAARSFVSFFDRALGSFVRLYFWLKVTGVENIPSQGAVLCPNHVSYLDGPLVHLAVPGRLRGRLFFVGIGRFFDHPIVRPLARYSRVIPLDQSSNVVEGLKASAYALRRGKLLCLFPEGARSASGEYREPKKGVAILAKELGIKIVPVYIDGTRRAWGPTALLPRPFAVSIVFGKAFTWEQLRDAGAAPGSQEDYEAVSRGIKAQVLHLKEIFLAKKHVAERSKAK